MGKRRTMDTAPQTGDGCVAADRAAAAGAFIAAVAAALPPTGMWSMPVLVAVSGGADSLALLLALRRLVPAGLERRLIVAHAEHDLRGAAPADRGFVAALAEHLGLPFVWRRVAVREFLESIDQPWREDASNTDVRHARNFIRHEVLPRCMAGPFPAATESLVRLGHQASLVAAAITSAAEHLLESHASRHADGGVVVRTSELSGLDRHLLAEVFVALWRREGWPQQDMTARHYAALAGLSAAPERTAVEPRATDLPGGIRATRLPGGWLRLRPLA